MKENIINFEYFVHSCFTCLAEICYHFAINTDNKEVKKDKISVPHGRRPGLMTVARTSTYIISCTSDSDGWQPSTANHLSQNLH